MNVNVVTAPEHRYFPKKSLKVFLAGGICNCVDWQKKVIEEFKKDEDQIIIRNNSSWDELYLLNPRRVDWIEEPGASERQIEWEFDMLERSDVFTMYFAGGESLQPICMYELGRNILKMRYEYPLTWKDRIIITCDKNYKRLNDVLVQTRLATDGIIKVNVVEGEEESINEHVEKIKETLKYVYNE